MVSLDIKEKKLLELPKATFKEVWEKAKNNEKFHVNGAKYVFVKDKEDGKTYCYLQTNGNANGKFIAQVNMEGERARILLGLASRDAKAYFDKNDSDATKTLYTYLDQSVNQDYTKETYKAINPNKMSFSKNTQIAKENVNYFQPQVLEVSGLFKKSSTKLLENGSDLYMIVCPDSNGVLSVWLADKNVVEKDKNGKYAFKKLNDGTAWDKYLQTMNPIPTEHIKKVSAVKPFEFFRTGTKVKVWAEAQNKGDEIVYLKNSKKEVKNFLKEARLSYASYKGGELKQKKIYKKVKVSTTVAVGLAAFALGAAVGVGTTSSIDKSDAARNYGKEQAAQAVQTLSTASRKASRATANNAETKGVLFNFVTDEYGNVTVSSFAGLNNALTKEYKNYKSGLGYFKYGFKQNAQYEKMTKAGIGEELGYSAAKELAENNVDLKNGSKIDVYYPVATTNTVEEAKNRQTFIDYLTGYQGYTAAEAEEFANAYDRTYKNTVDELNKEGIGGNGETVDPKVDYTASDIKEAVLSALRKYNLANKNLTADQINIVYSNLTDEDVLFATSGTSDNMNKFIYKIDLKDNTIETNEQLCESILDAEGVKKGTRAGIFFAGMSGAERALQNYYDEYNYDNGLQNSVAYVTDYDLSQEGENYVSSPNLIMVRDGATSIEERAAGNEVTVKAGANSSISEMAALAILGEYGYRGNENYAVSENDGASNAIYDNNQREVEVTTQGTPVKVTYTTKNEYDREI